jgi:hypothetical protein
MTGQRNFLIIAGVTAAVMVTASGQLVCPEPGEKEGTGIQGASVHQEKCRLKLP